MKNERDVEFTPSPAVGGAAEVDFTPSPGLSDAPGGRSGSTMGAQGGGTVTEGMQQVKSAAQQLVGQAQQRTAQRVTSRLDQQKHRAAESLSSVASTLRTSGQQLQGQQDGLSRYINEAADRVDDIAHYLQDREVGELVEQVEDFARRQPVAFLGGAFALGVVGARFLKSSRSHLVHEGVRDRWDSRTMTSRIEDPERDAVGRPNAPGYAAPSERSSSDPKAAGPRTT